MSNESKARVTALMEEISSGEQPQVEAPAAETTTEEVPAPEAGEVAAPAQTEGETPPEGAGQEQGEGSPGDGRKPLSELSELEKAQHAFQRKTNKLTRRIGERDMRIAELEQALAEIQVGGQVQQKPEPDHAQGRPVRPTLESCDFDPNRLDAEMVKYDDQIYAWRRRQEKQQETVQQRQQRFVDTEAAFVAEHPDYYEATRAPHVPITQMVAEAVMETENPPAVAYYLAHNLEEAHAIAAMTPINAARAIGRIEAKLAAPQATPPPSPPQTVTRAPAVAPSVTARAPASKPVSEMSVEDHLERLRVKQTR